MPVVPPGSQSTHTNTVRARRPQRIRDEQLAKERLVREAVLEAVATQHAVRALQHAAMPRQGAGGVNLWRMQSPSRPQTLG